MKYIIDDVDKTVTIDSTKQVFELKTLNISTVRDVYDPDCVGIKIKAKSKHFDEIGNRFE